MNIHEAVFGGFKEEMEKQALLGQLALGAIGAAGAYGAHKMIQGKKKQRQTAKRRITGTFQPGAGMIAPPRAY